MTVVELRQLLKRKIKGVTISEYLENIPAMYEDLQRFNAAVAAGVITDEFIPILKLISKRVKFEVKIDS
jgi:hypothetical protein